MLLPGTRVNISLLAAFAASGLAYVMMRHRFSGYQLLVGGLAPRAATYAGFSERRIVWLSLLLGGLAAGFAGACEVAGPLGGRRRLVIREGRAVTVEGEEATSTISLGQMTYLLRFAGRISAAEALAEPSTTIAGDLSLGEAVLSALAVMI